VEKPESHEYITIMNEERSGIYLTEPLPTHEEVYNDYIDEWKRSGEPVVPYASAGRDYGSLLKNWTENKTRRGSGKLDVPSTMYFLVGGPDRILGMLHCRWELNSYFFNYRGHIAYGVRPSERVKGYASFMLEKALDMYRDRGINRVLLTCDKRNVISAGIISAYGGIFENETAEEHRVTQRYWISLR